MKRIMKFINTCLGGINQSIKGNYKYMLFKCTKCSKTFTRKESLQYHEEHVSCLKIKNYCEACDRKFASKQSLDRHLSSNVCKKNAYQDNTEQTANYIMTVRLAEIKLEEEKVKLERDKVALELASRASKS